MDAAAEPPNQQLKPQTEASRQPDGLILQPPLNASGLPSLGLLVHASRKTSSLGSESESQGWLRSDVFWHRPNTMENFSSGFIFSPFSS